MNHVPADIPLVPGQLFAGRYRVERLLGAGGYAYIFLAMQEDLERQVALKVMRPELFAGKDDAERQARFARFTHEGKLLSRLRDARTITMYDFGQAEDTAYMVFEYVHGMNLTELIAREGALDAERVARIIRHVALSLREAHALGIIHRDLKPDNIMVWTDLHGREQIKVLDFGIAKIAGDEHGLTQAGKTVGTPRYMAPERLSKQETAASDLYSLGLVAWELLVGRQVLDGLGSMQIVAWQAGAPSIKLPEELDVPDALRKIVDKMVAKPLSERWSSVTELLRALGKISSATIPDAGGLLADALLGEETSGLIALDLAARRGAAKAPPEDPMETMQLRRRKRQADAVLPDVEATPGTGDGSTVEMGLSPELSPDASRATPRVAPGMVVPPASASPSSSAKRSSSAQRRQRQRLMVGALVLSILTTLALLALFIGYIVWHTR
jgi:serine/threonine protein kinase